MKDRLQVLRDRFDSEISAAAETAAVEKIRASYLSRKGGELSLLLRSLKDADPAERPALGNSLNALKAYMEERLARAESLVSASGPSVRLDVSLPGRVPRMGTLHPVTQVRLEIEEIFGITDPRWHWLANICTTSPLKLDKLAAERYVHMLKTGLYPAKLAAMEGLWTTQSCAPMYIVGWVNTAAPSIHSRVRWLSPGSVRLMQLRR